MVGFLFCFSLSLSLDRCAVHSNSLFSLVIKHFDNYVSNKNYQRKHETETPFKANCETVDDRRLGLRFVYTTILMVGSLQNILICFV